VPHIIAGCDVGHGASVVELILVLHVNFALLAITERLREDFKVFAYKEFFFVVSYKFGLIEPRVAEQWLKA